MIGQTSAEVFGHILFSFTRSVAEHYNFHEGENQSAIFGYDTLDDTGKEWYSQPAMKSSTKNTATAKLLLGII